MSLLDRFRRIERPRSERSEAPAVPGAETSGRFAGVERPTKPPASPRSGADLERFGPEPAPRIELVETSATERPFTRCMRCGMDHHVFATECTGCGTSLDTAAQRDFNERLWARRQEEAAREARAAGERRAARELGEVDLAAARRAMGEELAREVGARERARLDAEEREAGLGRWLSNLLGRPWPW